MKVDCFKEYCTGCGLCSSIRNVSITKDCRGFPIPNISFEDMQLLKQVCPCGGRASEKYGGIWGNSISTFYAWAKDKDVRKSASSGGVLTSLCCYLLCRNLVDGIIQTRKSNDVPYETVTVISRTEDDVKKCMGSRYSISSPLLQIKQLIKPNEKYAFVGKPCDVSALRMYMEKDIEVATHILYLFSFFCAGMPSEAAQIQLLEKLECSAASECSDLQYRGNGWPGYTTAIKKDGTQNQITYSESWGRILGRDVRKCCRFCFDGIGELADISCGDAWFLTSDNKPDFSEHEGRNVVFARTNIGAAIIKEAAIDGFLVVDKADEKSICDNLKYIQTYQYERRAGMESMIAAMRISFRNIPAYNKHKLNEYKHELPISKRLKRFLGTIKRILQGKI